MKENVSFGTQNLSQINNSDPSGSMNLTVEQLSKEIGSAAEKGIGDPHLVGLMLLAIEGYMLYNADVGLDGATAVVVPTLFMFGKYGLLPMGQGTIYGTILAVAGLFTAGLLRYWR